MNTWAVGWWKGNHLWCRRSFGYTMKQGAWRQRGRKGEPVWRHHLLPQRSQKRGGMATKSSGWDCNSYLVFIVSQQNSVCLSVYAFKSFPSYLGCHSWNASPWLSGDLWDLPRHQQSNKLRSCMVFFLIFPKYHGESTVKATYGRYSTKLVARENIFALLLSSQLSA